MPGMQVTHEPPIPTDKLKRQISDPEHCYVLVEYRVPPRVTKDGTGVLVKFVTHAQDLVPGDWQCPVKAGTKMRFTRLAAERYIRRLGFERARMVPA